MQKLYCYVDESGQDTEGRLFVVAVVVLGSDKEALFAACEQFEQVSGKGKFKWGKAEHKRRMDYLRRVFADSRFKENLRYCIFRNTTGYDQATITAIARAIQSRKPTDSFTTLVYVDGLTKTKKQEYSRELRKLGVPTYKVQGVTKDENNALTRLADAIAGFVRDVLDGNEDMRPLFEKAKNEDVLLEV